MVPMAAIGQGKLEGATERGVSHFLGIPFAKPPVGPLRFRPPERPDGWNGVRDVTRFGPASYQASRPLAGRAAEIGATPMRDRQEIGR